VKSGIGTRFNGPFTKPALCVTGRGPFDDARAKMLIQLLEKHLLGGRVEDDAAVSSSNIVRLTNADLKVICIGIFLWFPKPKLAQSMPQVPSRVRRTPIIGRTWVDKRFWLQALRPRDGGRPRLRLHRSKTLSMDIRVNRRTIDLARVYQPIIKKEKTHGSCDLPHFALR
jgi:hypothetical protein